MKWLFYNWGCIWHSTEMISWSMSLSGDRVVSPQLVRRILSAEKATQAEKTLAQRLKAAFATQELALVS